MVEGEEITYVHEGVTFRWTLMVNRVETTPLDTHSSTLKPAKSFMHSFHKKYRHFAEIVYLPFVVQEAKSSRHHRRTVRIFTIDHEQTFGTRNPWVSTTFDYPSTFETLAIDRDLKQMILMDLELFMGRKDQYRAVGKAWKRGYLLYGPLGAGKSSLIAAIANHLTLMFMIWS